MGLEIQSKTRSLLRSKKTLLFLLMSFLQKYLIFNKVKSKKQLAGHSNTCHMPIILATRRLTNSKLPRLTYSESLWKDERREKEREGRRKEGREGDKKQQKSQTSV